MSDVEKLTEFIREHRKPRPLCRDCADAAVHGRCDRDGSACDPNTEFAEKLIAAGWVSPDAHAAAIVEAKAEALRAAATNAEQAEGADR